MQRKIQIAGMQSMTLYDELASEFRSPSRFHKPQVTIFISTVYFISENRIAEVRILPVVGMQRTKDIAGITPFDFSRCRVKNSVREGFPDGWHMRRTRIELLPAACMGANASAQHAYSHAVLPRTMARYCL